MVVNYCRQMENGITKEIIVVKGYSTLFHIMSEAEPRVRAEKPTAVRPLLQLPIAKPRRRASDEANDKVRKG